MVFAKFRRGVYLSENRVHLECEGVAALAENMMDGPLRAPKAGALPTALHPVVRLVPKSCGICHKPMTDRPK